MPIYEYTCDSCENELEIIQKVSDDPITTCPSCNQETLKKRTSRSAFHLKGGGWYKDGYADSKKSGDSTTKKPKEKTPAKETKTTSEKKSSSSPQSKAS